MTVYVITHKPDIKMQLPNGYRFLLVGANGKANPQKMMTDNNGENISDLNPSFCELTGLYSVWKNEVDQRVGLVHYRRFFSKYETHNQLYLASLISGTPKPVSVSKLNELIDSGADWVLATQESGGEGTLKQQFAHFHHLQDLEITRQIIAEKYPASLISFDDVMNQKKASFYNMFYTTRTNLTAYCGWLFDILFEVKRRVDTSNYDSYQQRLFGFLAERLLNVWVAYQHARVGHLMVYNTEHMNRIDAARLIRDEVIKKK